MKTIRHVAAFLILIVVAIGCGRPEADSKIPKTDSTLKDGQGQAVAFDVEALPIKDLMQDPDMRIQMNAKKAYEHLQDKDFSKAMYNLTALASMPMNNAQTDKVATTMKEVVTVVKAAAEGGNENAQFALRILADSGF